MSSWPSPAEETNPYAAPLAEIGAPPPDFEQADSADEALRREHLTHEARVRSIGILGFVGMVLWGLMGAGTVIMGIVLAVLNVADQSVPWNLLGCLAFGGLGAFYLAIAFACFALARGLRRLWSWARWTWAVLFGLPIVGAIIAGICYALNCIMGLIGGDFQGDIPGILAIFGFYVLLPGWLLYLLLCRESRVIFTPEYRAVVARTPHIKYKTGRWTKRIAMLILMVVIAALVIAVLLTSWS